MFGSPKTINVPGKVKKRKLLDALGRGLPAAIAEHTEGVDPGTVDFLISLGTNEIRALDGELAVGQITQDAFDLAMVEDPLISWAIEAKEAAGSVLKSAYRNVVKDIEENHSIRSSKWFIERHTMTEKDKALVEVLKIRATNERLQILAMIKEHSSEGYREALKAMGFAGDGSEPNLSNTGSTIKQLNAELRKTIPRPLKEERGRRMGIARQKALRLEKEEANKNADE